MSEDIVRPAWSNQFAADAIEELFLHGPMSDLTREWAWGESRGKGVRVAIVDSGIEHDHPALEGSVLGGVAIEYDEDADNYLRITEENQPADLTGHGTACAGIIHAIAPEAELYSVRVLGNLVGAILRALSSSG
jgi:subtilisin family serine protease